MSTVAELMLVKRTQVEMMEDRGYNIDDERWIFDDKEYTFENFVDRYGLDVQSVDERPGRKGTLSKVYTTPNGKKAMVKYYEEKVDRRKISSEDTSSWNIEINKGKYTAFIVISSQKLSPDSSKKIKLPRSFKIEMFSSDDLYFNITKHFLQPKFLLIRAPLPHDISSRANRLPRTFNTDPIARYYGAEPGDIFEVTRRNIMYGTMIDKTVIHRIVIPPDESIVEEEV